MMMFCTSYHEFWPDDLSILEQTVIDNARIHGPKQVTDVYLLALAVKRAGRFVTFDSSVPLSAVLRAEKAHLAVTESYRRARGMYPACSVPSV